MNIDSVCSLQAKKPRPGAEKNEEIYINSSDKFDFSEKISFRLPCIECDELLLDFTSDILHLKSAHQISNHFECPIDKCWKTYHTKYSLKYHLIHCHSTDKKHDHVENFKNELSTEFCPEKADTEVLYWNPDVSYIFHNNKTTNQFSSDLSQETLPIDFKTVFIHKVEEYISNLYNILNIPRSLIQTLLT